ncbi:MAG TPA: IPT/TIG domain-containing protein [Candidatus Acidoferrales bacterium]|nr:IPT/TIG domain-containing protein [Candidatus Acidoferrales bacterium]
MRNIFVLGALLLAALQAPAEAQTVFGKNLVVNGDAESGTGTNAATPASSISGWTIGGSPAVILYTSGDRLNLKSLGPANRGKNYFSGTTTAKATLTQKIDISSAAAGIDAGTVAYDASGYLGGSNGDTSQMIVTFQNTSGGSVGTFTLGPVTDTDKDQSDALYYRRKLGQVPSGTRSVTIEIDMLRSGGTNNDGCADNISFQLNNDAAAPSGFFGSNLIVNGNAEAPSGTQLPVPLTSLADSTLIEVPFWVRSASFSLDTYSPDSDLAATDPGPADRGSWYFYGGPSNPSSTAYQDIDLAGAASQIDGGKVTFSFSGWIGGYSSQGDSMKVTALFMNWSGQALGSSTLGPVTAADRGSNSKLLQKSQTGSVPAGTRMVRVTMASTRTDGSDNDGLADSLALVLTTPGAGGNVPSIQSGGVVSASAFGGFTSIAPGTWVEIYGSNLAGSSREWAGSDFKGSTAPNSLDGTSVTIAGQQAFIRYISSGQVNAQIPSNVAPGSQQLTVTTANGTSAPFTVPVNAAQPGLLAPAPTFVIGGKQYVVAQHADGSFVLPPNSITGVATRQAQPGEAIVMYGIGFGSVTPATSAGQIVGGANQLAQPLTIQFGSVTATVQYDGLAPGFIGLYQFNVVVPNISDNDAVPLTFNLGGAQGSQTLYIAVKRGT